MDKKQKEDFLLTITLIIIIVSYIAVRFLT